MAEEQPAANDGGEFEREPVPKSRLLGFGSFVGMYAGEHTAGTELMIGPLFVARGASAADILIGLLIGNGLAVLSWMLMTAPIATRARLTLYFQLEKITGRKLVTLYSLANGAMFCILAGSMITVSATALGVWFDFPMPQLDDALPNSVGWVIAVVVTGIAFTAVAAFGYEALARFANLAAPWMLAIFVAFGLVGLKQFIDVTGTEVNSAGDLWTLCNTAIWKGTPLPGQSKFTLAHIIFFSWFCNMAMHIGMSDLSVFRFAKKSWYGLASASGMYLGHFVAWIAASVLYALQLHEDPTNTVVAPGPLADRACGIAGLICVIVAGWTTANPTIYRSGLAFQAIVPKASRVTMTVVTGLLATIAGLFPLIAMKLLDFVAMYGLLLMPMGAVVFVDFWLMRKFGLQDRFAERAGLSFNWAAGTAWIATIAICGWLAQTGRVEIFFVGLPGWFMAAGLYIILSAVLQRGAASRAIAREAT